MERDRAVGRPHPGTPAIPLLALSAVLVLAGCASSGADSTSDTDGASPTPAFTREVVAWMGTVCDAERPLAGLPDSPPEIGPDPAESARTTVVEYISGVEGALRDALARFDRVDASPAPDGDDLVDTYTGVIANTLPNVERYRSQAQGVPPDELGAPLLLTGVDVTSLTSDVPDLDEPLDDPVLEAARVKAPECHDKPADAPATPTPSSTPGTTPTQTPTTTAPPPPAPPPPPPPAPGGSGTDACLDGDCEITVSASTRFDYAGRFRIDTVIVTGVSPDAVSFQAEFTSGTVAVSGAGPGGTVGFNDLTIEIVSISGPTARLRFTHA